MTILTVTRQGATLVLEMNEPARRNALSMAMRGAFIEALERAGKFAEGAPLAIAMTRSVLARGLAEALEQERTAQAALFTTADHAEGKAAFVGKRKPDFKGA